LLRKIRSLRPDTPTLLITGYDDRDLVLRALRSNAFDFIQKPIELDYFIASVGRAVHVHHLTRQVRDQQNALAKSREDLRALAAQLITVQEEERRRLSGELHDDLNQRLVAILMQIDALQRQMGAKEEKTRQLYRSLRDQVFELTQDVRRMSHQLHPSILDHFGLPTALQAYVEDFAKREQTKAAFFHQRVPAAVPPDTSMCLYRVTQEALRNIAKHARATKAVVRLRRCAGFLQLSVWDDGVGFDLNQAKGFQGLGLISMKERAQLAGGRLTIRSRKGAGTVLFVRIPLPPVSKEPESFAN
jgi:signal transduction histidine kinase